MRIADSHISMASNRKYQQAGTRTGQSQNQTKMLFGSQSQLESSSTESFYGTSGKDLWYSNYGGSGRLFYQLNGGSGEEQINTLKGDAVGVTRKAEQFFGKQNINETFTVQNKLLSGMMRRFMSAGMFGKPIYTSLTQRMMTYYEAEETGFVAKGQATTEDGRTIDFNVDILMSRSFMEYADVQIPVLTDALTDPLMINVGADTVQIFDQKFRFDLDGDGVQEEISMPGKGTGFLALDLNEDGIINDGNELFGTSSGDGFADLRKYDSDGNGWIDENDEVFSKLKVWCKGENGEDILMDLKAADVGAIFLGNQGTEFSLQGQSGGLNGVVRATGIFLRESGSVGTVQHVDLASKSAEETEEEKKLDELLQERERSQTNGKSETNNRRARELARRKAEAKRVAARQAE